MKKRLLLNLKVPNKQKGFTLIEMVVVIAIIVMLLMIIAPNLAKQRQNAAKQTDKAFQTTLQTQVELYLNDHPHEENVTFKELGRDGYLTEKQVQNAKKFKIEHQIVKAR